MPDPVVGGDPSSERSLLDILADWREAERRLSGFARGPSRVQLECEVNRLRAEYQRAYATVVDSRGGWEVRAVPPDDRSFLADAQAAVASSWQTIHEGRRLVDEVRAKLRVRYPACELRLQDDLARLGHEKIIYAFRDGEAA